MSRPPLIERADYLPGLGVEQFIVPLLRAKIVPFLEALSPADNGPLALDVGCGQQPFRALIETRGYGYVSVDAQNPVGRVDHVAEIDKDLPPDLLGRGPFDFILCTEVLEHVADWDKAFSNFSALLKPKGRLLITCPHFYHLHEIPYDFWRPTVYALEFFADRWKLDCLSLEKAGTSWDILGTVLGANLDSAAAMDRHVVNRLLAWTINALTHIAFRLLRTRFLQRRVAWGTDSYPLYLSNVALLEKRPSTAADTTASAARPTASQV